jgi:hypothetical protein
MFLLGAKEWKRPFNSDGLYDGTLFEAKLDRRLESGEWTQVLAQLCYYVRWFWESGVYKGEVYSMPRQVVGCDKNEAFVLPVSELRSYVVSNDFDWRRSASSPDPRLVDALQELSPVVYDMTQSEGISVFLAALVSSAVQIEQQITVRNFVPLFRVWKEKFGKGLNPQQVAWAFVYSLERKEFVNEASGRVLFGDFDSSTRAPMISVQVPVAAYSHFWDTYIRPPDNKTLQAIRVRKDQLVAMQQRRETGEFFTPLDIAALAREYILKAVPDAYENWNWWDPCCGTGNLELELPPMPGRLFMSTLNQEDIDAVRGCGQNPEACLFQYDFLNQTDEELPEELRAKLVPGSKWIFFMNPPFAAGTKGGPSGATEGQRGRINQTTTTRMSTDMKGVRLGHASGNFCSQFLWHISKLVEKYQIDAVLCTFSSNNHLAGSGYKEFRTRWLKQWKFCSGFCVSSLEFEGPTSAWSILLTLWKRGEGVADFTLDVFDRDETEQLVRVGKKGFNPVGEGGLSKWVERLKSDGSISPPFKNGIELYSGRNLERQERWLTGALGCLTLANADRLENNSMLMSTPRGGRFVVSSNFERIMAILACHHLSINEWFNQHDQLQCPDERHPAWLQYSRDVVVFGLFNVKNQTSSLGNIQYKGKSWDIPNHFFWLTPQELSEAPGLPFPLYNQCQRAEPRFVAKWLQDKVFSPDAQRVLELGKKLVLISAGLRVNGEPKYQLATRWDAGWYQIRMGLYGKNVPFTKTPEMVETYQEFKDTYEALGDRLRPMIYELGFLQKPVLFGEGGDL